MCLVAAFLALELTRAAAIVILIVAVLAYEALVPRPRLEQRTVYAEVLTRKPTLLLGDGEHFIEKFDDSVVFNQTLAVLRENCGHSPRHPLPDR